MKPYMQIETAQKALVIGYLLVIIAAVSATISSNMAQSLMTNYPVAAILFWISFFEGVLSVILTYAFEGMPGYGGWSMPTVTFCVVFMLGYTVFGAVMDVSSYYTYNFLPVSQVAILLSFTIIILYICQRTVLYNDGNANVFEVCGITCTMVGAMLTPIFSMCDKKTQYEQIH